MEKLLNFENIKLNYICLEDQKRDTKVLFEMMRKDRFLPKTIVEILRGGALPGNVLSDFLYSIGIEADIVPVVAKSYIGMESEGKIDVKVPISKDVGEKFILKKDVVIIDDISDKAATFNWAVQYVKGFNPRKLKYACIDCRRTTYPKPDYFVNVHEDEWLIYEIHKEQDLIEILKNKSNAYSTFSRTPKNSNLIADEVCEWFSSKGVQCYSANEIEETLVRLGEADAKKNGRNRN